MIWFCFNFPIIVVDLNKKTFFAIASLEILFALSSED